MCARGRVSNGPLILCSARLIQIKCALKTVMCSYKVPHPRCVCVANCGGLTLFVLLMLMRMRACGQYLAARIHHCLCHLHVCVRAQWRLFQRMRRLLPPNVRKATRLLHWLAHRLQLDWAQGRHARLVFAYIFACLQRVLPCVRRAAGYQSLSCGHRRDSHIVVPVVFCLPFSETVLIVFKHLRWLL